MSSEPAPLSINVVTSPDVDGVVVAPGANVVRVGGIGDPLRACPTLFGGSVNEDRRRE
jgi:hypothetical protein